MRSLSSWVVLVFAIAVALSACVTAEEANDGCELDSTLCPASKKTATRVICDCTCDLPDVPLPGGASQRFRGNVAACLPSALNPSLAKGDEKKALDEMSDEKFSQEVFRFCARDMADWLSLTIKSQVGRIAQAPAGLGCSPYTCRCGTKGAKVAYGPCQRPCTERPCGPDNCMTVLRNGGTMETDSCLCGRTEACGFVTPPRDRPPICRVLTFEALAAEMDAGND